MSKAKKYRVYIERYVPQHCEVVVYADDEDGAEDSAQKVLDTVENGYLKWEIDEPESLTDDGFAPWILEVEEDEETRDPAIAM